MWRTRRMCLILLISLPPRCTSIYRQTKNEKRKTSTEKESILYISWHHNLDMRKIGLVVVYDLFVCMCVGHGRFYLRIYISISTYISSTKQRNAALLFLLFFFFFFVVVVEQKKMRSFQIYSIQQPTA